MCKNFVLLCVLVLVFGLTAVVQGQDPDPSLLGWWKLDEGAGETVLDSSGRANDGTLFNPKGGLGQAGSAWDFDPTRGIVVSFSGDDAGGTYIIAGMIPDLDLESEFTWVFWAKQHADQPTVIPGSGNDVMLGNRYGGTETPLQFVKFTPGKFEYYNDDPSYLMTIDYEDPPAGQWVHHVAVKKGATLTYYRDGVEAGTAPVSKTMDANPFYMGGDPQGERWRGRLSDVRLYERALSADEIKAIFETPIAPAIRAWSPDPVDGAEAVTMSLLQWKAPGPGFLHDVYLGTGPELTEADLVATRLGFPMYYHVPGLTAGETYYWRVDELEMIGGTYTGNVWSFTMQALTAYRPEPPDGVMDASVTPTLTWLPGQTAVTHHVYFSGSFDDVNDAAPDADQGELEDASFAPGDLDAVTTYYWRVDEILADGTVRAGSVWTFTTSLPVDDFESYTDDVTGRIFQTWIDGWGYTEPPPGDPGNGTGATIGYTEAPFAEQTIVHSGLQSMPLEYNNVDSPFYSEGEREFAISQDWTVGGVNTLVLHVRGRAGNDVEQVYVALRDAFNRTAAVAHRDPNVVTVVKWAQWEVPLSEFTAKGVDVAAVKTMYIGLGDREAPVPGGAGLIYVDDIYVTQTESPPEAAE